MRRHRMLLSVNAFQVSSAGCILDPGSGILSRSFTKVTNSSMSWKLSTGLKFHQNPSKTANTQHIHTNQSEFITSLAMVTASVMCVIVCISYRNPFAALRSCCRAGLAYRKSCVSRLPSAADRRRVERVNCKTLWVSSLWRTLDSKCAGFFNAFSNVIYASISGSVRLSQQSNLRKHWRSLRC